MRLKLISCDVLYREMCAAAARAPHQVDMAFLPKGLHDIGCVGMRQRLQEVIDKVDDSIYDAILLGYGLCNNGIHHLKAGSIPLVIPRGHDCITFFLGSRERYLEYFHNNPGTYFQTSGWMERGEVTGELKQQSIGHLMGMDQSYDEMVKKYGEDNAQFLWETLCEPLRNYSQMTYIEMGLGPDSVFETQTRQEAQKRSWKFDKVKGDLRLFEQLVAGNWDPKEFLVVQPGQRVVACNTEAIIAAEA